MVEGEAREGNIGRRVGLPELFPSYWCLIAVMVVLCQYFPGWHEVWLSLSPFARTFLLLLMLVGVYALYFTTFVLLRLRSFRIQPACESLRNSLTKLDHRSTNLGQIILAMFYLFGFVFFVQMQNAFWTPDNNRPVGLMVLENFRTDFRFAALMFFAFLILQCVQWFISARICAALRRLSPHR